MTVAEPVMPNITIWHSSWPCAASVCNNAANVFVGFSLVWLLAERQCLPTTMLANPPWTSKMKPAEQIDKDAHAVGPSLLKASDICLW